MSDGNRMAPVAATERIQAMDVLRGFALVGILLMNIEAMVGPLMAAMTGVDPALTGADRLADALVFIFVQGKFYTLFSLLFGMGFAVMMARARAAGRPFAMLYLRRTLVLLGFGLVHALLIWSGDILTTYALIALFLLGMLVLHRASWARWAAITGALSVLVVAAALLAGQPLAALSVFGLWFLALLARLPGEGLPAYAVAALSLAPLLLLLSGLAGLAAGASPEAAAEWNASMAEQGRVMAGVIADQRAAYGSGTYAEAVAQRWQDLQLMLGYLPLWGWQILGMFLLGAWFVRSGVIAAPERWPRFYLAMRWLAFPVGLGLTLLSFRILPTVPYDRMDLVSGGGQAMSLAGSVLMCLGWVGWAVRGLQSGWSARLLALLAPAGRMALTNYLTQSVVCTLVFYGYGLGYFEQLPRAWQIPFVFALFSVQVVLSHWWMARFRFGPVEWVWRALTYLQRPPMRRA